MADYMDDLFKKIKDKKGDGETRPQQKKNQPKPEKKAPEPAREERFETDWPEVEKSRATKPRPEAIPMESPEPARKQAPAARKGGLFGFLKKSRKEQELKEAIEAGVATAEPGKAVRAAAPQPEKEIMENGMQEAYEQPGEEEGEAVPKKSKTEKEMELAEKEEIDAYGKARIYRIRGQPLLYYRVPVVRAAGPEKTIINTIKEAATRIISIAPYRIRDPEERRNVYTQKILEILRNSPELRVPKTKYQFYAETVVRDMVGYGVIDDLIKDDKLEEIMVIGPQQPVYVFHREYEMMITNIEFYSDNEIQDLINRIARQIGRRVDLSKPLLDARLPDGSRVNATIPPASVQGSTLTIRKFREDPYTILDLIRNKTLDPEVAAFLWLCVEGLQTRPANILIAGGTGSGKTTTLNVMASFIPERERIVSIEDTAELNLPLKHWIRMEARPPGLEGTGELTLDILTKNSLRMRPDRIIVGEIRHKEAFSLFTALNTGHDGSMGTVHANTPEETVVRVTSPPMDVPGVMLSGLNFILVQHRLHDKKTGTIRRITEIAEVAGVLQGHTLTEAVYKYDARSDSLKRTKSQIKYLDTLEEMTGTPKKKILDEIQRRARFFSELASKKERIDMATVKQAMKSYILKT